MVESAVAVREAIASNSAVYLSLEGTKRTIRLLQGSRNWLTGKVSWKFTHYKLGSLPRRRYTALSYSWGRQGLSEAIQLNGRPFKVLESVFAVLDTIAHNPGFTPGEPWSESWWWIDSVCINQNDPVERESQVKLMGEIYRQSHRTVGWLGVGSAEVGRVEDRGFITRGEIALESLRELCHYRDDVVKGPAREKAMRTVSARVDWDAVGELLRRPWWTRVWTLQEFLIPSEFELWCGMRRISRNRLKTALFCIWNIRDQPIYRHVLPELTWLPAWNRRRLFMWQDASPNKLPLVALVAFGSYGDATDPRDRIYSVLGLARRKQDAGLVQVRYDKNYDASDAFTDFAINFVKKHQSLDIICFTHIFNQKSGGSNIKSELPSWVPDWSARVPSYVTPVMASQTANPLIGNFRPVRELKEKRQIKAYTASGTRKAEYQFQHRKILKCKCITVDTIRSTEDSQKGPVLNPEEASHILESVAQTLVMGRKDRYLTSPVPRGYFYHPFRDLLRNAMNHGKVPRLFLNWFHLNRGIRISGHTLEEICNSSMESPSYGKKHHSPTKVGNEFFERFRDSIESMGRVLRGTESGRVCLAPVRAVEGDRICVLLGCSVPVVLRPKSGVGGDGQVRYELIGECYLEGFMDGEAVGMGEEWVRIV